MGDDVPTRGDRPSNVGQLAPTEPGPDGERARPPRYEIGEEIARGGMGRVSSATDHVLGRTVALKETLSQDRVAIARFRREIAVTARLEHPSIVPLYDAGTSADGTPFYVMRKISGRPLDAIVEDTERLDLRLTLLPSLLAATQAIAHAHEQGIIHRDIKPSNILVGERGETFVIDWGIAKIVGQPEQVRASFPEIRHHSHTQHGLVLGTPGFLAPEHRRTDVVTTTTDVYSLGATLFFTLTQRLPVPLVPGDKRAHFAPAPPIRSVAPGVPRELASIVDRALAFEPEQRYADGAALADDLQRFLSGQLIASHHYSRGERFARFVRRRRVALLVGAIAIAASVVSVVWATRHARVAERETRERRVVEYTKEADALRSSLAQSSAALERARTEAFALFDKKALEQGEERWRRAQQLAVTVDDLQARIAEHLEHALVIDASRVDVRNQLAEILLARAEVADRVGAHDRRDELLRRLALHDTGGTMSASWHRPATVTLAIEPRDAKASIAPIVRRAHLRVEGAARPLRATEQLEPGAYVVTVEATGRASARLPIAVARGERLDVALSLPARERIPDGFIYIPPGRFLIGSADEPVRRGFLSTVPLHEASTGAYLIARHETTFGQWIAYLDQLDPQERERRRPRGSATIGVVELAGGPGAWRLHLQPTVQSYDVAATEQLRYLDRHANVAHDWRRLPVLAVGYDDAVAFAGWLRQTGRVPNARLCTEHEWERAARGADDREFPHGDQLLDSEANFDETYRHKPRAMGPDTIGSWPASRSPFGVFDMAGNAGEWATSSLSSEVAVLRGGSWYWGALTARATNRWTTETSHRTVMLGVRLCADL